jgi:hypothetical protein
MPYDLNKLKEAGIEVNADNKLLYDALACNSHSRQWALHVTQKMDSFIES